MDFRINSAFRRFPAEGQLVGHILASFGEIELSLCSNAAEALDEMFNTVMKALCGLRVTSARIETADRLMQRTFEMRGLTDDYANSMLMVKHCLKIRNQFSHCNWADHEQAGMFFADLQVSADTADFCHDWKHVDVPLLKSHVDYFGATMEMLEFLRHDIPVRQGRLRFHVWPKPTIPTPPPLHNPADQHVRA